MNDDDCGTALLEKEILVTRPLRPVATADALVVEDDPEAAQICSRGVSGRSFEPRIVWTGDQALEFLRSADAELEFVFVDLSLADGRGAEVAAEARRLFPGATIVTASRAVGDVLLATGVVLCHPFTAEQFDAAFDAALFEGPDGFAAWSAWAFGFPGDAEFAS